VPLSAALLRVRSDEQLVSLFRAGSDDAFSVIHERYHARLLAYARQMLRSSGGDAEDALQDVFVRAFKSLRASNRPVLLRAWLYRIAHNRCIDELRRPIPVPTQLDGDARPALSSAADAGPLGPRRAQRAVARLVADVRMLPPPQRSALLMRELQGLSYQELVDDARRLGAGGQVAAAARAHGSRLTSSSRATRRARISDSSSPKPRIAACG
jgi:RNA polymerase sigma factor (sigma-70 family)